MKKYLSISHRNPGHWDVWDKDQRLCRIRGEAGNVSVYRHYSDIQDKAGFATVSDAVQYIFDHFMRDSEVLVKVRP